eukprot:m.145797 g.145797  ORF g.145797 m.145797 type:complete len:69 (+) comp16791_c1_seq3:86-292(+)
MTTQWLQFSKELESPSHHSAAPAESDADMDADADAVADAGGGAVGDAVADAVVVTFDDETWKNGCERQ